MTRVLLAGQGRWVRVLRDGLREYASEEISAEAWPLDSPRDALSLTALAAALRGDVIVRVGFRPGARTPYGIGFDLLWRVLLALNRHARAFVYWIGTDVSDALEDARSGRPQRRSGAALRRMRDIAGSERLAAELVEAGVKAKLVPFPGGLVEAPKETHPLPASFTVLSYVPDGRSAFYGGPSLLEAARALPDATFLVAGGSGRWAEDVPPNMEFLGWVEDMAALLDRSTVVVRMVEHDSVGGTAIEALLHARHLVYSYALPHAVEVDFGDEKALVAALAELCAAQEAGTLAPNDAGREWALVEFDRRRRFEQLASVLTGSNASPPDARTVA